MNASIQHPSAGVPGRALTYPPPLLRILVVIDGRIELNKEPDRFGLGYALDALHQMPSIVNVVVGIVTREESISDVSRGGHHVLYCGFKFTQDGFNLDNWDQVWIFADQPNIQDGGPLDTDSQIGPPYELTDAEALRLAEWMDRGGGVFAAGDHSILGASLCHRIPRVRTMRRWTRADRVPEDFGSKSNQTLQGESGDYALERDLQLQPVELAYVQTVSHLPFGFTRRPHPLMCTRFGPIEHFPDHMHEGEVVPEDEVDLDRDPGIPGYTRREYPPAIPELLPFAVTNTGGTLPRPRPQVIVYGRTTNPRYIEPPDTAGNALYRVGSLGSKRFGLVSVYDGARSNVGRVICDSTWHHWFSYNLDQIAAAGNTDFAKMTSYYRNVALWLARLEHRREIGLSGVWSMLTLKSPMAFAGRRTVWELGEKAAELFNDWVSPCWINEFVVAQFDAVSLYSMVPSDDSPGESPWWGGLPEALIQRAVLGSLCLALAPLASEVQRLQLLHNDVKVDKRKIEAAAAQARAQMPHVLKACIANAADSFRALGEQLAAADEKGA